MYTIMVSCSLQKHRVQTKMGFHNALEFRVAIRLPEGTIDSVLSYIYRTRLLVDDCYMRLQFIQFRTLPSITVVVVRLERSHGFIDSLDNHSTASGPAWCRLRNAVSGHSLTMCIVVWWLSPQGATGDVITHLR